MASSEGTDFRGVRLDDADFSGARLHSPNLEGARVTDGWLRNADISGYIEGLYVNGVEVAPLVEAELDRRFPERVKLRAVDPPGMVEAWAMIEEVWRATVARARTLPEASLFERVDDEWSFVETLRHLIFATDTWLLRMIRQEFRPYHPSGLAGSFLTDPVSLGLDYNARPTLDEVLAVRYERMGEVKDTIATLTGEEVERICNPPDAEGHPREPHSVLECLNVILDEEWEHSRYANRDLNILGARPG
ncbi:MAG: DinB family protein [Chloroflexota bacterium]|nr:DinB family protein [Chloroflexota bacterium]